MVIKATYNDETGFVEVIDNGELIGVISEHNPQSLINTLDYIFDKVRIEAMDTIQKSNISALNEAKDEFNLISNIENADDFFNFAKITIDVNCLKKKQHLRNRMMQNDKM